MHASIAEHNAQELGFVAPDLSAPVASTDAATLARAYARLMFQANGIPGARPGAGADLPLALARGRARGW